LKKLIIRLSNNVDVTKSDNISITLTKTNSRKALILRELLFEAVVPLGIPACPADAVSQAGNQGQHYLDSRIAFNLSLHTPYKIDSKNIFL